MRHSQVFRLSTIVLATPVLVLAMAAGQGVGLGTALHGIPLVPVTAAGGDCTVCHTPGGDAEGGGSRAGDAHNGQVTHSNQDYGGVEAPFTLSCWDCHDVHDTGNRSLVRSEIRGYTVVFTQTTGIDSFDEDSGDPSDTDDVCVTCHINATDNPGYPMTNHAGGDHSWLDTRGTDCTTCHPHETGFMHGGGSGSGCVECHGHDAGTLYDPDASAPYTPGAAASQGRGTTQSHSTHTESDSDDLKGPGIYCDTCHDITAFPYFKSGTDVDGDGKFDLSETDVCDSCHSPGGTYDGVDDAVIGAKDNWSTGVYTGSNLISGKEKWCAGCHDEMPSMIQSVSAPNVVGDEDADARYGTGYGYYKTGHGLATNKLYPATGAFGAGLDCLACHSSDFRHIDGVAKTYTPDSNYLTYDPASANYQNGFRLKDVSTGYDNKYPMHIPRTGHVYPPGFREDWEFALCFECHDRDGLLGAADDPNTTTNFRDHPVSGGSWNSHDLHTDGRNGPWGAETPQYDSDFDGTADSRISCMACHNVHGSSSPAMFRRGELAAATSPIANVIPFLDLQYVPLCDLTGCSTLPESTGGAGTRFYAGGAGALARNGVCNMCHNEYWFDGSNDGSAHTGYRRTPIDATIPRIAWVHGQVGSNVLQVRFSEGVYSELGAVGDLTPADFALTDADDGRTVVGVTHAAGDIIATLLLSAPLDATDDIGTDTLAAATAASIYNVSGNAVDTTPVTISGDASPPTVVIQSPANGATDVAADRNLTFDLSDDESGVDWTTFSIVLSGDKGYSRTYTDADTAVVSRAGTPASYGVIVDPDADFGLAEYIAVTVQVDDVAGNSLVPPAWSFTTTSNAGPQTMVLHPSGLATNYNFASAGGVFTDVLDSNDGDASYAHACCGPAGQYFAVDMDDPVGLAGATIEGVRVSVYARYRGGPWPGAVPYAGNVDIGYKTGTSTIWKGNTLLDTSGDYNLVQSVVYTADSDGGPLDLVDIENLQIVVRRGTFGPPQLRATEVYAEVVYTIAGGEPTVPTGEQPTIYLPLITKGN